MQISLIGRIPVLDVAPVVDGGARPAKSVVDETFPVTAVVFREGHDQVAATAVLTDPDGRDTSYPMVETNHGLAQWGTEVSADRPGMWHLRVEGWADPYGSWVHDAVIKVSADIDTELMLAEGAIMLRRALTEVTRPEGGAAVLRDAIDTLGNQSLPAQDRLAAATSPVVTAELQVRPLRDHVTASQRYPLVVERERALYGAWYEIFPRSEGAYVDESGRWVSGTLRTAAERLPAIADMGFDVVYLTPIHPIGATNKKGKNNSLHAEPDDPGSPYAIGSPDGGMDAIHPDLGTFADFDYFVERAQAAGLEVALDIALNCSPDHPWVTAHPEWYTTRADGTIAYAENPPKKYQDIYPLSFDNDPQGLSQAIRDVIEVWLDHGVRIFRVDNPHTKPVEFWQWLIADVAREHPETIWLSEAFTRPPMMHTLGKVGFQQSYTYYAWRNTAAELREYVTELAQETAHFLRPSFWPTTHDILTPYLTYGGWTAHKVRAALAATLSPTYGIYTGYEHVESAPRLGAEEHVDNEKYELKDRRWADDLPGGPNEHGTLAPYLTLLNRIRREHPALHWLRNITFHAADDENVLVFSKRRMMEGREDTIIVVANTDPHQTRETRIRLSMPELGLGWSDAFEAHDLVTGHSWDWGQNVWVRVGPDTEPVHIVEIRRHG